LKIFREPGRKREAFSIYYMKGFTVMKEPDFRSLTLPSSPNE
jgi:hypothetical protein